MTIHGARTERPVEGLRADASVVPPTLWRVAACFAVGHVAMLIVGILIQNSPRLAEGTAGITRSYLGGKQTTILAGGVVEAFGFVLLVPALVFLAQTVGRRTVGARWATQAALLAGLGYVVASLAVGLPSGAAALYGVKHDLDLDTALALNNVRNVAYFLSLSLLGVHALGLAIAALGDKIMSRWLGWGGVVTAVALFVSVPAAAVDQHDWGSLVWTVWWLGVAGSMARYRPSPA